MMNARVDMSKSLTQVAICPLTATEEAKRANVRIRFIVDDIVWWFCYFCYLWEHTKRCSQMCICIPLKEKRTRHCLYNRVNKWLLFHNHFPFDMLYCSLHMDKIWLPKWYTWALRCPANCACKDLVLSFLWCSKIPVLILVGCEGNVTKYMLLILTLQDCWTIHMLLELRNNHSSHLEDISRGHWSLHDCRH